MFKRKSCNIINLVTQKNHF